GLRSRQEPEAGVLRDLAVDHRDEFVVAGRLVESRVEVLEQSLRDLAEDIELVKRTEQERLVEHRRQQRIGRLMSRDIDQRDAGSPLATQEIFDNLRPLLLRRVLDPGLQVEPLFEVDIDDVIAADEARKRKRPS